MKKEMWERDGKRDGETRVNIKDSQLNYSPSAISTDLISGWFMQKSAFVALFFSLNPSNSASPREWALPMESINIGRLPFKISQVSTVTR